MTDNIISIQYDSDIAKGNEAVRISFYANIGFFLEVAQMFEFNLRKLICYERSVKEIENAVLTKENVEQICAKFNKYYDDSYNDRFTLGKLVNESKVNSSIPKDFFDFMTELNKFRIFIVHQLFQRNIINHDFESAKFVHDYTSKRIVPMTNRAIKVNKAIINIIDLYRTDLRDYKKQVGIEIKE